MIKTHIQGIPCQAEMTSGYHYEETPPVTDRYSDVVDGYKDWWEVEFKVYDRNGHHAPWLEQKMSYADQERIRRELADAEES